MIKKNIVFVTANRADFGKLKPLIRKIENSSINFDSYTIFIYYLVITELDKSDNSVIDVVPALIR